MQQTPQPLLAWWYPPASQEQLITFLD